MFKESYNDGNIILLEDGNENRIVLQSCYGTAKKYYSVFVKAGNRDGETIATKALLENALAIGKAYFN